MTSQQTKTPTEVLVSWRKWSRESQYVHYEAAKVFERYNHWIGVPVAVLATLVGTSVFASLGKTIDPKIQILVGLVSVFAAALAGLQTFLGLSERSAKHKSVAARYGSLRREIEQVISLGMEDVTADLMSAIRKTMDGLADEAPNVPPRIWDKRKSVHEEKI